MVINSVQRPSPLSEGKEMFEKTYLRHLGLEMQPPACGGLRSVAFWRLSPLTDRKSSPQNKVKLAYVSSAIMSDRIIFQ